MEIVIESFQRWFNGNQLTTDDTTNIVMGINPSCAAHRSHRHAGVHQHSDPFLDSHRLVL